MLPLKKGLLAIIGIVAITLCIFVTSHADLHWNIPMTAGRTWSPSSSLNISDYVQVEPQFYILPRRKNDDTSILILVTSTSPQAELRNEIRNTWAHPEVLKLHRVEVNFVIGIDVSGALSKTLIEESDEFQDILVVNVMESYLNLTLKSVFILQYLSNIDGLQEDLKTVLKTDDDCYVNVPALGRLSKTLASKAVMVGAVLGGIDGQKLPVIRPPEDPNAEQDKWAVPRWMYKPDHFPKSLSGSGYAWPITYSKCLLKASFEVPYLLLEDVYVTGFLAKKCRISLKNSGKFQYMGMPEDKLCLVDPHKDVVIHRVNMTRMHQRIQGNTITKSNNQVQKCEL